MRSFKPFVLHSALLILAAMVAWQCTTRDNQPTSVNSNPTSKSGPSQQKAAVGFPDLTVDSDRLAGSIQFTSKRFKSGDCSVIEGCVVGGKRKLMKFDVKVSNLGTADLIVGAPGDTTLFEFSPCHGHYHYKNFSEYLLKNASGTVVRGRKQAFCMMDIEQVVPGSPSNGYTCANQGISAGWADVYGSYLDCQWLDITGVPKGSYTLEISLNLTFVDQGANTYPDVAAVPVTIR